MNTGHAATAPSIRTVAARPLMGCVALVALLGLSTPWALAHHGPDHPEFSGPAVLAGPLVTVDGQPRRSLSVLGPIGPDAASTVIRAVDAARLKPGDIVLLSSPGGLVGQAMDIGDALRRRGLSTVVGQARGGSLSPGRCASSCALIVAGGAMRTVVLGSTLGLHAISAVDSADSRTRLQISAKVDAYLDRMGVGTLVRDVVRRSRDVVWLSWPEAALGGLVNARPLPTTPDAALASTHG